jgi:hypothetical protein
MATATTTKITPVVKGTTFKQGDSFTDTAGRTGIVNYDSATGKKLATGGTTTALAPGGTLSQSTTTLSSNKDGDILNTSNNLDKIKRGVSTDTESGISTYANGDVYTADTKEEDDVLNSILKGMMARTDADTANSIKSIKNKYDLLKNQQEKVNESKSAATQGALFRSGAAQGDAYAANTMAYQTQQNLEDLQSLDMEEEDAIISARAAQSANNFKLAELKYNEASAAKNRKLALTDKINENLIAANEKARADASKASIEASIADLYSQGITDPAQIQNYLNFYEDGRPTGGNVPLKDVSDTVALLSGIGGTGIVGEYNFYVADSKKRGLSPMSFNEYQDMDANRKKSIAAAANASGYSPATLTKITQKAGQFDNEPSVRSYQVVAEGKSFLDSIDDNTKNPADQQGVIYAFAKIMDPNSVVREGEYNTVQKYAQSWASTFGFNASRIFSNTPFLSAEAIKNMKKTITAKVAASEKSYKNIYNEYDRIINKISGGNDGKDFLTDYSQGYGNTVGGEIIKTETEAQDVVDAAAKADPKLAQTVYDLLSTPDPTLGRVMTYSEIQQYLESIGAIQ